MTSPAKVLADQFVLRSPGILLAFGVAVSMADFSVLYIASAREGVLNIPQGVGMLRNYGLFSTLLGNSISFYVAKKYYEAICSLRFSEAVIDTKPVRISLARLKAMILMKDRYAFAFYGLFVFGTLLWIWNLQSHIFGNPEIIWGHKVFDSADHPLTFSASRLHNLYTWMVVLPFVGHVIIYSSIQLSRAMTKASRSKALKYDLLNPDQHGGFGFVDKSHIAFNVIVALVYIQITLHIITFTKMNPEHVIGYIILTVLLIGINRMFLGDVYSTISTLRREALNRVKEDVLKGSNLNFEILKYSYERRITTVSVINFIIKTAAIAIPGFVKFWPNITKAFTGG